MAVEAEPGSDYAIIATGASADDRTHVLKAEDTFAVLDRHGDIVPGGLGQLGLYSHGTRFLSRFELGLARHRPLILSSAVTDEGLSIVHSTNPDLLSTSGAPLRRETLHLSRATIVTANGLRARIRLQNYGLEAVSVDLDLLFDADFADVFEVRGAHRNRRGSRYPPSAADGALRFDYLGLDGVPRATRIALDPAPLFVAKLRASWHLAIGPGEGVDVHVAASCDGAVPLASAFEVDRARAAALIRERVQPLGRVRASHAHLDLCLQRSAGDLAMMLTATPAGPFPYAGVPWFCTPFGRDGIVTALELLWLHPPIAAGVLRYLASTQSTATQVERDAEPGKIMHEARSGEMAALGEVPFGRYFGSVDATPLFVVLAGAYERRTGDRRLIEELWPNLRAALDWVDRYGDADGDGFVEYARRSSRGLRQQGWKDSEDSISDELGDLVEGPIALAEVQAYVYGAKREAARLAIALGDPGLADRLERAASELRERFDCAFWCEDLETYALALDGVKRPCRVRSSNAGHALLTGLAREERAPRVATTLLRPDLFSGWGVRTLSTRERRYNPIAYHNGTVWPHDNAIIASGLARYGLTAEALRVFDGVVSAASWLSLRRLPELYCGFERRGGQGPTSYPVACAPQAWAAGAPYLLLASILGMEIEAAPRRIVLRRPRLPPWLERVSISCLEVGDASVDLDVRLRDGVVEVSARTRGAIDVLSVS